MAEPYYDNEEHGGDNDPKKQLYNSFSAQSVPSLVQDVSSSSAVRNHKSHLDATGKETIIDKEIIRNEWVDALFSAEFFPVSQGEALPSYIPSLKGMGNAKVPSYVAYTATISPRKNPEKEKLGVTISRIPLGAYAHFVDPKGQAYAAGVLPGSILVDINGIGVLGEPSHKLIERLWQYEGFGGAGVTHPDGRVDGGIIALTLVKDAKLYSVLLFNKPPFGISWMACGNFALVQRSYSFAKEAGIKRGCIIASVNGRSFRNLDHAQAAEALRDLFISKQEIRMVLAYTPAASRSSHFFSKQNITDASIASGEVKLATKNPQKNHPGPLLNHLICGSGSIAAHRRINATQSSDQISELAAKVAAGEIQPTSSQIWKRQLKKEKTKNGDQTRVVVSYKNRQKKKDQPALVLSSDGEQKYYPCPMLEKEELLDKWNIFNSLFYNLKVSMAGYAEENSQLIPQWQDISSNDTDLCVEYLEEFGADQIHEYLLQVVGTLACNDITPEMGKSFGGALVDLVQERDDLCFRLHFLLQSFIGRAAHVANKSSSSYKSLTYVRDLLSKRLAEMESMRSVMNLQNNLSLSISQDPPQEENFEKFVETNESKDTVSGISPTSRSETDKSISDKKKKKKKGLMKKLFGTKKNKKLSGIPQSPQQDSLVVSPSSAGSTNLNGSTVFPTESTNSGLVSPLQSPISNTTPFPDLSSASNVSTNQLETPPPHYHPTPILRNNKYGNARTALGICNTLSTTNTHDSTSSYIYMSSHIKEMNLFLKELDSMCKSIQKRLFKTFSQKVADLAMLQPAKEESLMEATEAFRRGLAKVLEEVKFPLVNPCHPTPGVAIGLLSGINPDECFILPSAHFPLLLSFNQPRHLPQPLFNGVSKETHSGDEDDYENDQTDVLYKTKVEVIALRGVQPSTSSSASPEVYVVQASVAGQVLETDKSTLGAYFESTLHRWYTGNSLTFDTRSSWGPPKTLSIQARAVNTTSIGSESNTSGDQKELNLSPDIAYCWVDISRMWKKSHDKIVHNAPLYSSDQKMNGLDGSNFEFDMHGEQVITIPSPKKSTQSPQKLELELRISTEAVLALPSKKQSTTNVSNHHHSSASKNNNIKPSRKKLLLYKHTDDLRQEMLALQFIEVCNDILLASGLDLKLRSFRCCPVGTNSGFLEWVPGAVPLSEICDGASNGTATTAASSNGTGNSNNMSFLKGMEMEGSDGVIPPSPNKTETNQTNSNTSTSSVPLKPSEEGENEVSRFRMLKNLSNFTPFGSGFGYYYNGSLIGASRRIKNPIQDFLRSAAYDPDAPYFIQKQVLDYYVKSCAGYCVLTYLLGVGDRHLDNLLLHPQGYFLHCDFSFILGQDPKTYLPMRITEEMVLGMGGKESDNFAKFLSLAGATFVALRRHQNVRVLLSLMRLMVDSNLPDVSLNQNSEDALLAMRYRFRLDLSEDDALTFMEKLIESSISSKLWTAVDAMHSIGKKF